MSCKVSVAQGVLEGKICQTHYGKSYYTFEGIPYAKPPVGELRFKAPVEPDKWTGVRDATKPGNKCAQLNPLGKGIVEGSEDCLYLNVYTPSLPHEKEEKLPVIFFIHGGRLVIGYGDYYRPDYQLKHGVILVTINYRLNILGFLCLDIPEVPGNAGLKDTVMALKWVKDNIKNFNGDEDNITVMGESAGAGIATAYLTSNMANGLYNKIICQSGVSISDMYIILNEDPVEKASQILSHLGHDARDKRKLYDIFLKTPVEDLIYAHGLSEFNRPPTTINAFLLPVVEKKFSNVEPFFDEPPIVVMRENRFQKLPILTTLQSNEGAPFIRRDAKGNVMFEENFQYFIPKFLVIKRNTPDAVKFAKSISDFYFNGEKVDVSRQSKYFNLIDDYYFLRDIILFVELLAKFGENVFLCRFDYGGNMNTTTMKKLGLKGATHGDLIQYLFYKENKAKVATERDLMVVDTLTEAWCNFAKTGAPSWKDNRVEWPPYTREKKLCLNIDDTEIKMEPFPEFERMKFWFDLIPDRAKL